MTTISIIVPVKNEEKNIQVLLDRIDKTFKKTHYSYRVIFIDDRSLDNTQKEIDRLSRQYPIKFFIKQGKLGKAFSILEGVEKVDTDYFVMLDADLQYAPETIPLMIEKVEKDPLVGVVVANRKVYKSSFFRRFASRANKLIFGSLLFGLHTDIQSGLKLVKTEIVSHVNKTTVYPWALDIPLLYTAVQLGFKIDSVDITFERRKNGNSKISFLRTSYEIAKGAIKLRLKRSKIYFLKPEKSNSMMGAGVAFNKKRFITHTTLATYESAISTLVLWQKILIAFVIGLLTYGIIKEAKGTAIVTIAILSVIYFIDVFFNFYLVLKSLHFPPEINVDEEELKKLDERKLPMYSILCPLYREAHVLPQFVNSISKLSYPKNKLDVLLLLEEDDRETKEAAKKMNLPSYVRVVIVPDSQPKTKPKACNYGLTKARGEYIVIFDAEDIPDPMQLKIAIAAFNKSSSTVVCLQAKLNYYNPHHNLLTRLFTAEYSLWFDLILTGLQSIDTAIPLGGTSNHFRKKDLVSLLGWDPFNVTEDCDLGARLFKKGYKTAVINSTTLEEANSKLGNWIRQRSRWIKGYIQTYLVHMRSPVLFVKEQGIHALIFQLVVGGKIAFMVINPILWLATISYFALYAYVGPTIESLYPAPVFYIAAVSLLFGNFLCLYYYMIGVAKREQWALMKYIFLVPFYWLMVSIAAIVAFVQLIFKPHYWEKTHHGFHLKKTLEPASPDIINMASLGGPADLPSFPEKKFAVAGIFSGAFFIGASLFASFMNFLYNAYLARSITVEDFAVIGLLSNLFFLSQIPLGALGTTVTHQSAYFKGKFKQSIKSFWIATLDRYVIFSLVLTAVWLILTPYLSAYFNIPTPIPFLVIAPIWFLGVASSVNNAYLSGNMRFIILGFIIIAESISKFAFSWAGVYLNSSELMYAATPLSLFISSVLGFVVISITKSERVILEKKQLTSLPKKFFATSALSRISMVTFLSLDLLLANHYLPAQQAGYYALLSLVGKMIFFFGSQFSQFIMPVVSAFEGAKKSSKQIFSRLFIATTISSLIAFIGVGLLGNLTVPILLGNRAFLITQYLPLYSYAIMVFTIGQTLVSYRQAKREYTLSIAAFVFSIFQVVGIYMFHQDTGAIVWVIGVVSTVFLISMIIINAFYERFSFFGENLVDLFTPSIRQDQNGLLRILIFNWRDTRHAWAGGAENYIHEIAKRWVKSGHKVTVFCGNDQKSPRNQVIDGVQMVRRGGFYAVYIWAFLYYVLKFKGNFDVVIDSENGIPFFTPIYVKVPKFLLIHHIHQDVFRKHLKFPLSQLARFLEGKLMPWIYKNQNIITISDSTKNEIVKLNTWKSESIQIVSPGVESSLFKLETKTSHPSFVYLGRLKSYKNLDILVSAFATLLIDKPNAKLAIAGEGETSDELKKQVKQMNLNQSVIFTGKIKDSEKSKLLAKAWVFVHPSMIEGWGITVIEANASGTPVIAANVAGLRDSVIHNKTGILVSARNAQALANAMKTLASNPAFRIKLSKQAVIWSNQFSWDKSADKFLKIIISELSQKRFVTFNPKLAYEK
ncbi:glycosyltransferase [Candidatus Gottesmanbacteria bacterium]|nr:glycosyltransferase [Candidatus Gottesmanbacteria bacterium]